MLQRTLLQGDTSTEKILEVDFFKLWGSIYRTDHQTSATP